MLAFDLFKHAFGGPGVRRFERLKDRAIIVIAGYPKDDIEDLKSKGIAHFIHIRSNILETLKNFHELLGIASE